MTKKDVWKFFKLQKGNTPFKVNPFCTNIHLYFDGFYHSIAYQVTVLIFDMQQNFRKQKGVLLRGVLYKRQWFEYETQYVRTI